MSKDKNQSKRPNVIWIFGDQHRAQALGINGDPNVRTPNLDRLAHEGLTFDSAVSGCPLCCPYRGALLSGQYPHKSVPGHEYPLPEGMPTIARPFNEAGYDTTYIGKWHIDGWHEKDGRGGLHMIPQQRRGEFSKWIGYENNNSQWDCWVHGHGSDGKEIEQYRLPNYETDALTDLLIEDLHQRCGNDPVANGPGQLSRPFFSVLSVQPPHNPYVADEQWMRRHTPGEIKLRPNVPDIKRVTEQARRELSGYYAMIENLDWNVGRVRDALWELGMIENTHIIFFSDHGDMHGSHGMFKKTNPYEESVRVPFIMGGLTPLYGGRQGRVNMPVNHVDIGATSLGLCGIEKPDWMAGYDYSNVRLGRGAPLPDNVPDSAYIQLVVPTGHGDSTDRPWRGVVTRDGWKYVCLEHQPWLMFNLNEDPYELANLAHNSLFKAQRTKLHNRLAKWISDTDDEFVLPAI